MSAFGAVVMTGRLNRDFTMITISKNIKANRLLLVKNVKGPIKSMLAFWETKEEPQMRAVSVSAVFPNNVLCLCVINTPILNIQSIFV